MSSVNNREKLFFTTADYLGDLLKNLDKAKKTIAMEMFILEKDELSDIVFKGLIAAAARGVRVRVLVDGVGSLRWSMQEVERLKRENICVRVFNPVKFKLFNKRLNRRNHRKFIIVDSQLAYVGSFNLSQRYYLWRETVARIESQSVPMIQELFNYAWKSTKSLFYTDKSELKEIERKLLSSTDIFTTQSSALRKKYKNDFIHRLNASKDRVWLMAPYFNPPRYLLKAIVAAASRGIDVRLVLPQVLDIPWMRWIAHLHYPMLIRKGVKIYEYSPSILHAKMYLIDNEALVGTGNLNYRSFMRDIELNLALNDEKVVNSIEIQFQKDMNKSYLIPKDYFLVWYKQWIGKMLFVFKTSF